MSWTTCAEGRILPLGVSLRSPLRTLPFSRWASRFTRGSVHLSGRVTEPASFASGLVPIPAGPLTLDLWFSGGASPEITNLRCVSAQHVIEISEGTTSLDGAPLSIPAPIAAVEELLDHLHDLTVTVEAIAGGELWIKIVSGFVAHIPPETPVSVDAATRGPPNKPRLVRPLVVSVGGTGLSIRLPGSRWLKALASLAIRSASLAPDGAVELTGHGSGALDRVVGAGLRHTSSHLSDLVRRSPQFARVRSFLKTEED